MRIFGALFFSLAMGSFSLWLSYLGVRLTIYIITTLGFNVWGLFWSVVFTGGSVTWFVMSVFLTYKVIKDEL